MSAAEPARSGPSRNRSVPLQRRPMGSESLTTGSRRDRWNKWLSRITGIYWRPVFNLLEGHYEIVLVNAQHMHAIPGHKTDIKDSEWIADLLRHGLTCRQLYTPQAYSGPA